jgi:dinuclear metal center YbgI/SA1388 family protein
MDLKEFDHWCRALLEIDALASVDDSLNGVQVSGDGREIDKAAFAVDACAETIRRAAASGARLLFVHHGLFWGKSLRIEGSLRERLKLILDSGLALYACHLPLDKHPEVGNNAVLARMLGIASPEPFGLYHGVKIGLAGRIDPPIGVDEAVRRILPDGSRPKTLIASGPERITRAAVVSGGAAFESLQAIEAGIELYVTGEGSHSIYHAAVEGGLHFLAAGHYATEVWGVKAVAERLGRETGIATLFIDLPTGL